MPLQLKNTHLLVTLNYRIKEYQPNDPKLLFYLIKLLRL